MNVKVALRVACFHLRRTLLVGLALFLVGISFALFARPAPKWMRSVEIDAASGTPAVGAVSNRMSPPR
jgi:hypothetical protein